jgi:superfamily II DNA or RNA helicase
VRVRIDIDSRVRVRTVGLDDKLLSELRGHFTHRNPQHGRKLSLGIPRWIVEKTEPEIIRTWLEDDEWMSLPRGGLARVRKVLEEHGHQWGIIDRRERGAPDAEGKIPDHMLTPYEYQERLVEAAVAKEQCILRAPTGSGKTVALFELIARLKVATLILVPNGPLMRQWQARAKTELGLEGTKLGLIKGATCRLRPLTIGSPKTIASRGVSDEVNGYFGLVACDEAQLFAARTFYASVDPMRARYRVAVSADERRKDRKEFLVHDLFGDVGAEVKRDELVASGHILDVEVRVVPTNFRAEWYGMPEDEDELEDRIENGEPEKEIDFNRLLNEMVADEGRNKIIYALVDTIVNRGKQQVLVFGHRREHCTSIDRHLASLGYRTGFLIGGDDYKLEFQRTVAGLERLELDVGVGTYQASGTGLDLPAVGVGIAATPITGNQFFFGQVRGRLCRAPEGKEIARLYVLWDRYVYPWHLKNLVRWNKRVVVLDEGKWVEARHYMRAKAA